MKKTKTSSSLRLIAFFLVAVILICAFGFSADGWQLYDENDIPEQIKKPQDNAPLQNAPSDIPTDSQDNPLEDLPKFYNRLTGEETTEELSNAPYISFVMSSTGPLYGISSADLLIEFPTEDGTTRFLSFINTQKELTKIGSLSKNRGYISNLSKAFGACVFSYGTDDTIKYPKCDVDDRLTTEGNVTSFVYTEFGRFTYTCGDLIEKAFSSSSTVHEKAHPFIFNNSNTPIMAETYFNKISIPYSSSSTTSLTYSITEASYSLDKNGSESVDLLNSSTLHFKNCFILFADSATYENQKGAQMVLNTIGEGSGYYLTEGTAKQIKWSLSEDGTMKLMDENNIDLVINRGKSYISFVKSSKIGEIILS